MRAWLLLFLCSTLMASWKEDLKHYVDNGDTPKWMREQIDSDLRGAQHLALDGAIPKGCVRVKIGRNQASIEGGSSSLRQEYVERGLNNLLKVTDLPNMEFLLWTGDALFEERFQAPVFAFATGKGNNRGVILMPDFEAMDGNVHLLKWVDKAREEYPWSRKIPMAIWRGAMTGGNFTLETFRDYPRSQAVLLSMRAPQMVKAHFVLAPENENTREIYEVYPQLFAGFLQVPHQLRFKYQLLIDGNSCAYSRAFWQLFSDCAVFKHDSPSIQWYYRALRPYEHYIPVARDFSDLLEKLDWAIANDKACKRIANRGREFAKGNISYARTLQYMYLLLTEYHKRFPR